jgi:hypothetical protein
MIPISVNIGKMQKMANGKHSLQSDIEVYIYNGQKHRERGPAEINNRTGYKAWFKHGKLHNKGGPAVIDPVNKIAEYWIDGNFIRKEEYI